MRRILPFLALALGILSGCGMSNDDTTDTASPSTVQIVSPYPGTQHHIYYRWQEADYSNNPCSHWFVADTALPARVIASAVPGGVHSARIYRQSYWMGDYEATGEVVYPGGNVFDIPFFEPANSYNPSYPAWPDTFEVSFCVGIIAGDESFHLSGPVHCTVITARESYAPAAPAVPVLRSVAESATSYSDDWIEVGWCNPSGNVDSTSIYYQSPFDSEPRILTVGDRFDAYLRGYIPLTDYAIWLRARNIHDSSAFSDTVRVTTRAPHLPSSLYAYISFSHGIQLTWHNHHYCDSLLVERREAAGAWQTLATLDVDEYDTYFTDSTVLADSSYYYRLGLAFPTGTWWGDSLAVSVP